MDPAKNPSPAAAEGRLLAGRYLLVEQIGRGGMGMVWRAQDQLLDREVAVKELTVTGLPHEELAVLHARMQQEARAAARIKHPGVVTVFDVLEQDDRPWIVMELIDGRSLAEVIADEGTLLPRDAARLGAQVLSALDRAHQLGVLHRDVKPANVLLERGGRVVLTDFGIALLEGSTGFTRTGDVVGSPDYLAPERVTGHRPGAESDLWSLGVTLYAAVEGQSPFRRTSTVSTLQAVVAEELPEPGHAGSLAPVIKALLRKDPSERPTAVQAQRMLEDVAGGLPANPAEPSVAHPPTQLVPPAELDSEDAEFARHPTQSTPPTPLPSHGVDARPEPSQAGTDDGHQADTPPTVPVPSSRGASGRRRGRRVGLPIALAVVLAALVGGLAWALASHGGSSPPPTAPTATASNHPPASTSASPSHPTAAGQAKSLDLLLDRSAESRQKVVSAVSAVEACSSPDSVSAARAALRDAADERSTLIGELDALDLSQIPGSAQATEQLRAAWQHSADADAAYASWAGRMANGVCAPGSAPHDKNWTAGLHASSQATSAKKAFARMWNPIVEQYGLQTRTPNRI
ncbi:serine/threonine-protein kinase [Streptomyces sp. NBC_01800]|uniref:serine/threonine-protein kinase n=1 Tax=Streptomyces sp. NBC_01800 TaxID=2975945 RepID=UPI002DDBAA88|nr:serine/threonine-protein kinase [Streptomyces sp. NBC_01800]WSA74121.1 serine/threonine protein kinase [Streptomyces sp. NBC_01800]